MKDIKKLANILNACSYVNNSECFLSRAELIRQLLFFDWQD